MNWPAALAAYLAAVEAAITPHIGAVLVDGDMVRQRAIPSVEYTVIPGGIGENTEDVMIQLDIITPVEESVPVEDAIRRLCTSAPTVLDGVPMWIQFVAVRSQKYPEPAVKHRQVDVLIIPARESWDHA